MYQFVITLYFIILGLAFYFQNTVFVISCILLGIIILISYLIYKKIRKENIKKGAMVNINRANWWEFEELKGFNRVSAKKAVWIRKHNGKYLSKEDFYTKNSIDNKDEIEKFICL